MTETQVTDSGNVVLRIPRRCCWAGGIIGTLLILAFSAWWMLAPVTRGFAVTQNILDDLGMDGIVLFTRHDRDKDGFLSLVEFEPLAHRLLETKESYTYEEPISEQDEVITITAAFQPLLLDSISKDFKDLALEVLDPFTGLKNWKVPNKSWKNFAATHFTLFLPDHPEDQTRLGVPYELIGIPNDLPPGAMFSSNRYNPPHLVDPTDIMVFRLLSLLHPRPFVMTRFAPHGAIACIRAINEEFADVVFRIHAEFQLNEAPFPPFWFTPGQLTGHIIIARNASRVLDFHLYVPNDRRLNVDMEWLTGPSKENMEVDIGYLPQMELRATGPSIKAIVDKNLDIRELLIEDHPVGDIQWSNEITYEEAQKKLELKFFPFKKVPYHPFPEAFSRAGAESCLIHSIVLWGALDDQSC